MTSHIECCCVFRFNYSSIEVTAKYPRNKAIKDIATNALFALEGDAPLISTSGDIPPKCSERKALASALREKLRNLDVGEADIDFGFTTPYRILEEVEVAADYVPHALHTIIVTYYEPVG
ncbi:MAG: hypothetical protein MRY21_03440 [Simkaniaceae bacterium]|nr:hypothetical protein [Simkaniaceae bacterium]